MQTQAPDSPQVDVTEDVATSEHATFATQNASSRAHRRRWRLLTDVRSQLPLVALVFGVSSLFAMVLNAIAFQLSQEMDAIVIGGNIRVAPEHFRIYTLVSTVLMIAAATVTAMSMTHRIAGCAVKLRRNMQGVGRGEFDLRVTLREHDTLQSLATGFNDMAHALEERRRKEALHLQSLAQRAEALGPNAREVSHELRQLAAGKVRML